jgi:hypothetical protein
LADQLLKSLLLSLLFTRAALSTRGAPKTKFLSVYKATDESLIILSCRYNY